MATNTKALIDAAFAPKPGKSATVTLVEPIKRDSGDIAQLVLRKPNAGELRGFKLPDVINGDVNTIIALLPRIAIPVISKAEAEALETEDIAEISGSIFDFFMSPTDKATIAKMRGG